MTGGSHLDWASRVPFLVIGGGIGGLATALAVARTGRRVRLIEQAAQFAEIGGGLMLAANAARALDWLGVLDDAEDVAMHPEHIVMMHAHTGERLTALRLGAPYRGHYGYPYLVLSRHDLHTILLHRCIANDLVTVQNNRSVVGVDNRSDGVEVRCADGTRYECDAVVGADGLHSTIRQLFSADELVCDGYVTYRGVLPTSDVSGDIVAGDVLLWIGPGIHMVQFPLRGGDLHRQAAVFRSSTFGTDVDWGDPQELDESFAIACPQVRRSVALLDRNRRWPVFDRKPLSTWAIGRLALLGDAAHPTVQYLAQGAAQALEDAVQLASALDAGAVSVSEALRTYQSVRVPRATRCQISARRWGELWHTDDPVTVGLRDRFLRMRRFDDYSEVDWLYADPRSGAATGRGTPISAASTA